MSDTAARPAPDEVAPGIWRLVLPINTFLKSVNAYLVKDADGCAFVDCGMDTDECWDAFLDQLAALDMPVRSVHTIVATHGHPDHTGMADRIRQEGDSSVLLHSSEQAFIDYRRGDPDGSLLHRWLVHYGVPDEEAAGMASRVKEGDRATPAVHPTKLLDGGEEVRLGKYAFEVHWTPGHTPGHVCLYEPADGLLLCGDHILQDVAPNVSLQPYTEENPMPGYLSSLEWMAEMPVHLALPGHGQPFPSPRERALTLISHQMDRQAQLRSMLTKRPQTAYELAAQVWADSKPHKWAEFNPRIRRNAMATLAAHLELLADRGQARRVDDGAVAFSSLSS
ncbi:MAG TPA: MBL fold metallo-hydrolase [Chloroflexota bacterium]|nr:MBL fold metallo-hydrolase [Chloroflexota bacterium]